MNRMFRWYECAMLQFRELISIYFVKKSLEWYFVICTQPIIVLIHRVRSEFNFMPYEFV
jgi:hypothetical protein